MKLEDIEKKKEQVQKVIHIIIDITNDLIKLALAIGSVISVIKMVIESIF